MGKYWENVRYNDISKKQQQLHEAGLLKLNCDKALLELEWVPTLDFDDTIRMTVEWYKEYYQGNTESMSAFTKAQIHEYVAMAQKKKISWATS